MIVNRLPTFSFVQKGFTIPAGYTLRITTASGEEIVKQAGEQSGGSYQFQEVLDGVHPDWKLEYTETPDSVGEGDNIQQPAQTVMERSRVPDTQSSYSSSLTTDLLDSAHQDSAKTNAALAEKENNTPPTKVLSDSQKTLLLNLDFSSLPSHRGSDAVNLLSGLPKKDRKEMIEKLEQSGTTLDKFLSMSWKDLATLFKFDANKGPNMFVGQSARDVKINTFKGHITTIATLPKIKPIRKLTKMLALYKMLRGEDWAVQEHYGSYSKAVNSFIEQIYGGSVTVSSDPVENEVQYNEISPIQLDDASVDPKQLLGRFKNPTNIRKLFMKVKHSGYEALQETYQKRDAVRAELKTYDRELIKAIALETHDRTSEILSSTEHTLREERKMLISGTPVDVVSKIQGLIKEEHTKSAEADQKSSETFSRFIDSVIQEKYNDYIEADPSNYPPISDTIRRGVLFALSFLQPKNPPKIKVVLHSNPNKRASANNNTGQIHIYAGETDASVAAHEAAHILESSITDLLMANSLPYLFETVPIREKAVSLRDIYPHRGYAKDTEATFNPIMSNNRPLMEPYCTKVYFSDTNNFSVHPNEEFSKLASRNDDITATELVSVGIQRLMTDPVQFAKKEPAYFEFIMSLRTTPRKISKKSRLD